MTLKELQEAREKTVGIKQTVKAIKKGLARTVLLAEDADPHLTGTVKELCQEFGVSVVTVPSMKELGKACGIKVGAAAAAVLE